MKYTNDMPYATVYPGTTLRAFYLQLAQQTTKKIPAYSSSSSSRGSCSSSSRPAKDAGSLPIRSLLCFLPGIQLSTKRTHRTTCKGSLSPGKSCYQKSQ